MRRPPARPSIPGKILGARLIKKSIKICSSVNPRPFERCGPYRDLNEYDTRHAASAGRHIENET